MRSIGFFAAAICAACGGRSGLVTPAGADAPDASHAADPEDAGGAVDAATAVDAARAADAGCAWGFAPLAVYDNAGSAPVAIAIADLDGDGHADLAVNNYGGEPGGITLNTLRNNGDATFAPWQSYPSIVSFSITQGPFVSVASTDLVVGCDLFVNTGHGVFGSPLPYSPNGLCGFQDSYNNLVASDFDGDGQLDFGWSPLGRGVAIYLNRDGGSFEEVDTALNPVTPYMEAMTSADFDRDGRPDLAGVSWGYGFPSYLRILHNTGAGRFAETDIPQGDEFPKVIAAGDLDGDGWPDLVLDEATSGMAVLLNRRDGSFGAATRYTFAEEVRSIVIGDLNGDSAADVVFGGYGLGELGVFFNRGDGTFAPADHWRLTNNPWTVALGDLNGDGHLDIATAVSGVSNSNGINVFLSRCQ